MDASRFRHLRQLDGLRGGAVLLVLTGHTLVFRLGWQANWGQLAALGVLIFFGLSGFLITALLCLEQRRYGSVSLKAFYVRRGLRIFPALFLFILIVSILIATGAVTDTPWKTVGASLLYVRNIFGRGQTLGHLWSLSLEEQFYVVWPLVFSVVGRRRLFLPSLAVIGIIWIWRTVGIQLHLHDYAHGVFYLRPDFRMDSILVGCVIALYLDDPPEGRNIGSALLRWSTHPVWTVPALLLWTLTCEVPALRAVYLTVQTVLSAGLLFHILTFEKSTMVRILRTRWLGLVGLVSYSLYLWQQPFIVTSEPSWGFIRRLPYCLLIGGTAATISYLMIERPFLLLKRRFTRIS